MNTLDTPAQSKEENLITFLFNKYFPFWPLFVGLVLMFLLASWVYIRYATPIYEITATLIIKDEKKGVDESRMTESINAFASKKIVENEIEVIHSRALIKKVIITLNLYAPIYEENQLKVVSAYSTSPITIEVKHPEFIENLDNEIPEIYFSIDSVDTSVRISGINYPLNKWVDTPYGSLRFRKNSRMSKQATGKLYFILIPLKAVTDELASKIEVSPANKLSTVINLTLKDEVVQRGEDILNQLIKNYNQASEIDRNTLARNTFAFIEDRMKLVEEELDELESQVQNYKSSEGIVDLSEQGRSYLQNISENNRKVEDINLQLAVLDKIENYVIKKDQKAGIVPSTLGINDPVLTQLLQKLYDSEIQYQKLSKTTAANNPILISINDEIDKIRPSILENIHNQRDNLKASRKNLATTRGNYDVELQSIPGKERELLEISRQQVIKNNIYSLLLQKREETVLSFAPTASDSKVVDVAEASFNPVSPKRSFIYLGAIGAAFFLSIFFISFKELLSSKILYRADIVDYTHAPIVAEISQVKQKNDKLFKEPINQTIIEQFRQLRTALGLYSRTFNKKKILITSSIPGEGKSFISTNLAYSLAASGKKIVLVDFDMRNPKSTYYFEMKNEPGVTDYFYNKSRIEDILKPSPFNNLYVIPAGTLIGDNTELLLSDKLDKLFHFLERGFDYVVIDTSPLDLVSDGFLISEYCDISLLIIRHGYTPKNVVKYLRESNKQRVLQNMAIVYNGVKQRGYTDIGYGYGYGYGHGYGYKHNYKQTAS